MAMPLLAALLATITQARADIMISNPISGPPATPGDGLLVDYYKTASPPGTISNAQAYIAGNLPSASFISTGVGYPFASPGGTIDDTSTLSTYLGNNDAASLSNPSVGMNTLEDSIYHFTGFINITAANLTTTFQLGSDDGGDSLDQRNSGDRQRRRSLLQHRLANGRFHGAGALRREFDLL